MISHTTARFRAAFDLLPDRIQDKARKAYALWLKNPRAPSLRFKQVHARRPIYSIRIDRGWRALGVQEGDALVWFWIGSHAEYTALLSRR